MNNRKFIKHRSGAMKQAVSVPQEAIDIYNKALAFSNSGNYETALDEYRKAINVYPHFLEAYNNIGELYSKLGDSQSAIESYTEALTISKNDRVLLNLGVELYNAGKYDDALKLFQESLELNPNFLEAHFYTAMAFFNIKNYNSAVSHFLLVINFDQQHLKANYLLSYIYYEWKQYDKAVECLERIMDIADDRLFVNRYYGFCMFHLGKFDKSAKYLEEALKASPQYEKFKNYLSSLTYESKLKEIGDVDARIKEMEEKIMDESSKPSLNEYSHLSMLYIFNGEYKKAEELLESYKMH
jgi:tetratricopeptide (TPR) repeat protein